MKFEDESIEKLKRLHILAKPELKQALINIENIIKNGDGEAALFAIEHLSDAIKSHDHVEDILFAEIDRLLKDENTSKDKVREYYNKLLNGTSGELGAREADGIVNTLYQLNIKIVGVNHE